jgi:hypothetical protein
MVQMNGHTQAVPLYPSFDGTLNIDLSNALSQGVVNKNAMGK